MMAAPGVEFDEASPMKIANVLSVSFEIASRIGEKIAPSGDLQFAPGKSPLLLLVLVCLTVGLLPPPHRCLADDARQWTRENLDSLVDLYRHLHAHPELSRQEKETAQRIASELRQAGIDVTEKVGGNGVVGVLVNGKGPTIMLRADLDALPVVEQTGLTFASQVRVTNEAGSETGVMHACGHDVHMTNLMGTARFLASHKDAWQGTAIFLGQPAEEAGKGAKTVIDDGLFSRFPKPDAALALHVDSHLATGSVALRAGYTLANVDSLDITVRGKGGHGAYPHTTIDPIVQAAELVLALQTLVSRETKPTDPAVITIGSIHGGTKHNIIADSCHLQITVRCYSDQVRQALLDGITRKAKAIAASYKAPEPTITLVEGSSSLFNDEKLAARIIPVFKKLLGESKVADAEPQMGGEDFSEYGRAGVPVLMFRLGAVDAKRLARYQQLGQEAPSLHSALFYPDVEDALLTGVPATVAAAIELFRGSPSP